MERQPVYFTKSDYIETKSGNKVSRKSVLCGSQQILLDGKCIIHSGAQIRGDLAKISIGRNCVIGYNTVIRPPDKRFKGVATYLPMSIGDHVMIEDDAIIEAANVGSYVTIGRGAVISKRCILKECSRVLPGAILAPDTVVPPFSVYGGAPGLHVADLPESTEEVQRHDTLSYYRNFKAAPEKT